MIFPVSLFTSIYTFADDEERRYGVMIYADVDDYRPGFGGTTAVALDKRVQTWLEIVPVVLEVLRVKYVALMSHSAGTIYAFNTAVRLPHLLYPGGKGFMGCLGMCFSFLCSRFLFSLCLSLSLVSYLYSPLIFFFHHGS